ncbi:MAG: serine/threonine protein kinase [Polyangiaceae bacterium]|nr:serine/threonine protein kinase [Polyangiaceae bacterium]
MPLTLRMHGGGPPPPGDPGALTPDERPDAPAAEPADAPAPAARAPKVMRARRCTTCRQTFSGDSRFCPFDGQALVDAPDWNPSADPLLGRVIDGRYEVLSVVGEGGMGTVYEVRHTSLGRIFAMKVLRRDIAKDADLVARFVQEAKAAAAIGHPNIVAVSDFGEIEPGSGHALPYFVMEFLTGVSLAALLRAEKRLPAARVGPLISQCAAALDAAHRAGIIHRDLKPDNVFLIKNGDHEFVKLLDFGVAKIAGGKRLTRIGMVFGTPHYMSPEQAEGKRVDPRTDVYALGVIMYECFAGRVPFEADTYMGVLTQHMFAVPEPIERVAPDAAALGGLGPIVMRCLSKRAEDRYASMADLAAAIDLALQPSARGARVEGSLRAEPKRPPDDPEPAPPSAAASGSRPPLSTPAKVAIAVAAIGVPVALAFGVRAWRGSQTEPAAGAAPAAEPSSAPSADDPRAPAPAASPAATAPAPPAATAPAPPPSGAVAAASAAAPAASPPASSAASKREPPRTPRGTGEVVDPWRR